MSHSNEMYIHMAAALGLTPEVERLCMNLELVNETNSLGWSPIMFAAYYGHLDVVNELLLLGADVNLRNDFGGCAYTLAAASGNTKVIRALHCHQRIPSEKLVKSLSIAVAFGHLSVVRFLIDNGADPNSPMEHSGVVPLMIAITGNHVEIVKFLILRGANVEYQNCAGYSALHLAKIVGNRTVMSFINEKTGNRTDSLTTTCKNKQAVVQAARSGDLSSLKSLLSHSPSLSTSQHWTTAIDGEHGPNFGDDDVFVTFENDKNGMRQKQNTLSLDTFSANNSKVGGIDLFGLCCSPHSSTSFHYDCHDVSQLESRSNKCELDNEEKNDRTRNISGNDNCLTLTLPITSMCSPNTVNCLKREVNSDFLSGDKQVVRYQVNKEGIKGMVASPLILACFNGHVDAAHLLIAAGADPNRQREGRTPLMVAAMTSQVNMGLAKLLLAAGADPMVESNVDALTAFELASLTGADTEILRFIASYTVPMLFDDCLGFNLGPPLKQEYRLSPQSILNTLQSLVSPRLQNNLCWQDRQFNSASRRPKRWMMSPLQKFQKLRQIKSRRLFSTPASWISSESEANEKKNQKWKNISPVPQECLNNVCFSYNMARIPLDNPFESLVSDKISSVKPPPYTKCSEINITEEIKCKINQLNLDGRVLPYDDKRIVNSENLNLFLLLSPPPHHFQVPLDISGVIHRRPMMKDSFERNTEIFILPKPVVKAEIQGKFEEHIEKCDLKEYTSLFRDNGVEDVDILLSITEEDLQEMGVKCPEERKSILKKIHCHSY